MTKSLVFKGLSVNTENYSKHLSESASINMTEVTDTVDDGQTLVAKYDLDFEVVVYDSNIATDTNIYTNAAAAPVLATIAFQGVAGAATVTATNIIVNATKVYDNNRIGFKLFGSKSGVAIGDLTTDS